jgi:hypothetical protein
MHLPVRKAHFSKPLGSALLGPSEMRRNLSRNEVPEFLYHPYPIK